MTRAHVQSLKKLLQGLVNGPVADLSVTGIALDSRHVERGDLFIALPGTRTQGHAFVADAVEKGAVAVVCDASIILGEALAVPCIAVDDLQHKTGVIAERFYDHPSRDLFVVGVTGTNGKTSCSHFIGQALHANNQPCAVIGTLGNGFSGQMEKATHTTPDAITLHGMLRDYVDRGAVNVVMEVSSHGLEQGRVSGVNFDVAVFTNLSRDHLDYHGDMQTYSQAKRRLFAMPGLRYAVINGDDEFGLSLLDSIPSQVETLVYTLGDKSFDQQTVHGKVLSLGREGLVLDVESPWGNGRINSPLLGRFNASNLLAVLSTLLVAGVAFAEAINRLADLETVPGRVERFGGEGQPLVVVDYAHTPDALEQVLLTLREHCEGRLWCVFGCGGDRDQGKRPLMGAIAEQHADHVVLTDDNPRHENSGAIIADILVGMRSTEKVELIQPREIAIAHAIKQAAQNDVVLVAGKGHEDYQQVGDERRSFSDRDQVINALKEAA